MAPVRDRLLKCLLVLFFIPLSAGADEPNGTDLSKHFKITWTSSELNKSLTFNESSPSGTKHSERLSICLDVEILKPDLVFAITRECVITELTDRNGEQIKKPYGLKRYNSKQLSYYTLSHRKRHVRTPQPNKWLTRIQSVLKLPRRSKRRWSSKQIEELVPQRLQFTLDSDLCQQSGGEFATIKGYFYILKAESYEYVDGPFEPHKNPILLTNNDEIKIVRSIAGAEDGTYFLHLEQTSPHKSGIECYLSSGYMRPIEITVQRQLSGISVGGFLPNRILIENRLIGADVRNIHPRLGGHRVPKKAWKRYQTGASSTQSNDLIKCIRYVIAVNPKHCKIPFEIEKVPIPQP